MAELMTVSLPPDQWQRIINKIIQADVDVVDIMRQLQAQQQPQAQAQPPAPQQPEAPRRQNGPDKSKGGEAAAHA